MRKKDSKAWWWIGLFFVAALAIVAGYFLGLEKGQKERETQNLSPPEETDQSVKPVEKAISQDKEPIEPVEPRVLEGERPQLFKDCAQVQQEIAEFFTYLDQKKYVKTLSSDRSSYDRFKEILQTLSNKPPIPAGEGVDTRLITRNIFHFFRILDKKDLRLIREILKNEKDSMEINLALFYVWLTGKGSTPCPDREGIRPPLQVLYKYAGFFLNTIGGRSYLFRRPGKFRLLVSFYSLLIVHDADMQGKNTYGIDVLPLIQPLVEEIALYPDLYFKDEYLERLDEIALYYEKRR
ncbi:MAG: hypothetical protein JRJ03_07455 [Deltaproteobacteria bacterium]|nr:hypothetical protein [Deltaproteobacteria bacterium]